MLSNTNKLHFEHVKKKFPVTKLFTHSILSYELGHRKPNRPIFKIALKKSKFKAHECIFIDDKKENIMVAKKLGMHAVQFVSTTKLITDLKNHGVRF